MENFYKELLHSLNVGIYFVDRDRRITFWNEGAEIISGYTEEKVMGSFCSDGLLMHTNDNGEILCFTGCPLKATISDGNRREAIVYMKHAKGHRVPVQVIANPIKNDSGEIIGAVEVFSDISPYIIETEKVKELESAVNYDQLTGVLSRRYAMISLERNLFELKQHEISLGVVFIDINYFKQINDTYGHNAGDQALKIIAKSMSGALREKDMIARIGGDEFLVILQNTDVHKMSTIAKKLETFVEASEFMVNHKKVDLSISSGIALATPSDTIETLIQRADKAMYENKAN